MARDDSSLPKSTVLYATDIVGRSGSFEFAELLAYNLAQYGLATCPTWAVVWDSQEMRSKDR